MFNVSRRVNFSIVIALTVGWGIFFLLFLASSNTLLEAQQAQDNRVLAPPPGVRVNVQVDKRVYRGGETLLLAVRNDSRPPIWIQLPGDGCAARWWTVERLASDGESWSPVAITKQSCPAVGLVRFPNHSLKTDQWTALVPGPQIGDILIGAPAGTYRIAVPYLKGKNVTAGSWPATGIERATSPQFSIL
ncbi:MAG: hypothetical protein AAB402_03215 [Patescibacteria group bacterium]